LLRLRFRLPFGTARNTKAAMYPPLGWKPPMSASVGEKKEEEVSSAARSSTVPMPKGSAPDPSGEVVSHLRRGPPCVPRVLEDLAIQRFSQ
ncbi:MAG: hypothetical protein ACKPKO_13135, partial [Candidatus Fonsibacter sp.]